jgi:hypothetical protein
MDDERTPVLREDGNVGGWLRLARALLAGVDGV